MGDMGVLWFEGDLRLITILVSVLYAGGFRLAS